MNNFTVQPNPTEINLKRFLDGEISYQEVADFAIGKVIEQGRPSIHAQSGFCKYRGPDGVKCAVGHLLPDSEYYPKMDDPNNKEEGAFSNMASNIAYKLYGKDAMDDKSVFLDKLQNVHDRSAHTGVVDPNNSIFLKWLYKHGKEFYASNNLVWPFGDLTHD